MTSTIERSTVTRALRGALLAVTLWAAALAPARAGRTCEPWVPSPASISRGLELGKRSLDALEASGAAVALIARAGQDLTEYRLRWSHMAFAWRDHPDGRWTVVHELNGCGSGTSSLYAEGLGKFFLDDPFRYEALVVIPDADTQRRLVAMLASDQPATLHEPRYNVVAFPFSTEYQNSNQWLLEVLASTLSRDVIADRTDAQAWLKGAGYRPSTLEIPAAARLGARLFRANVAFDDHPFERRMAGHIDAVSVESVVGFMQRRGVVAAATIVALRDRPCRAAAFPAPCTDGESDDGPRATLP